MAPLGSRNVMFRLPVATRVLVAASTPIVSPRCQKAVGETGPDRDAGMTVPRVAGAFSLVALTVTVPFTLLFVMFRETNDVGYMLLQSTSALLTQVPLSNANGLPEPV